MKLLKGVNTDIPEKYAPKNTWRGSKGFVFKGGVLVNEQGVSEVNTFSNFLPIGEVLLPDNSMLYVLVDDTNNNKITRIKDGVSIDVTSFNFGFTRTNPIRGKAKFTNDLDIEVILTDDNTPPRFITIDKETGFIQEDDIEDTLLFPKIRVPNFELIDVGGGGNFKKGTCQVLLSYKFLDGGYTNWVGASNPIIITNNGGSFELRIINVDIRFDEFKVGIIINNNGVVLAEETLNDISVTGNTKVISLSGGGKDIVIEELLLKSLSYNRIADLSVVDNSLYAANLSRDPSINYQQYANNILIEPVWDDVVALDTVKNSYQDPLITFEKKGFANDIYAMYIRWYGLDGIPIGDFHIPMTTGTSTMSLHTNQNETYPVGEGYPETNGLGDNVRHHKFPKTTPEDFLITPGEGEVLSSSATGNSLINDYDGSGTTGVAFGVTTGTYGTFENDSIFPTLVNNTWVAPDNVDIDFVGNFSILATGGSGSYILMLVEVLDSSNTVLRTEIDISANYQVNDTPIINGAATITLNAGEKLRVLFDIADVSTNITLTSAAFTISEAESGFGGGARYYTKPTGISVSNLVIPQVLLDKVQGFEIMYARRNASNSSIVAQDIVYPRNWQGITITDRGRVHDFGLLFDKPGVTPNKLEGQYLLTEREYSLNYDYLNATPADTAIVRDIVSSKYVPHDNIAANNSKGEEFYEVTISQAYSPPAGQRLLANIINQRDDYYLSFDTQVLVGTGKVFIIPDSTDNPPEGWTWSGNQWTVNIAKLYGGDTYTILNKIRLTTENPGVDSGDVSTINIRTTEIPVQTKYNSSLREWGDIWYEKEPPIYPPRQELIAAGIHRDVSDNSANQETTKAYELTKEYTTYHEIDRGYLNENDKIQATIQGEEITDYPHRIIRTPEQNLESNISSWRQFKPNDYYEQNKDRGEIVNLATFDTDKLIIHHERGLFITAGKEKLATNITEIVIGSGDIFERAPKEPIYSEEGFLGTSHKFFNRTTPLGYIFESERRFFLLSTKLQELSKNGIKFHMDELLKDVGDNPYIQNETDNDFVGGISVAYDRVYERLFISINKLNSSECWTYSNDIGSWVGNHIYTNNKFFNTSSDFYSIADKRLFVHNADNKCIDYDGNPSDSYIIVSFSNPEDITKIFSNIFWNSTVRSNGTTYPDKTFNKIHFWNSVLDSRERTMTKFIDPLQTFDLRRTNNIWRYNKLRIEDIEYKNRKKFIDDYITVKLIFDNTDQLEIIISDIEPGSRIVNI